MESRLDDSRSGKVIFVTHCILNQNAKVRGIATYPGSVRPIAQLLIDRDIGIFQMPCPEMGYAGAMRWGQVKDQYNTPMFRRYCHGLADLVLDHAEEYVRAGYRVLGFVMEDGSPVCGLQKIPQPAGSRDQWGGMVWDVPDQEFVDGSGVFCDELMAGVKARQLGEIPFVSVPEVDDVGSMAKALAQIEALLG